MADADLVVLLEGFQPAVDEAVDQQAPDRHLDVSAPRGSRSSAVFPRTNMPTTSRPAMTATVPRRASTRTSGSTRCGWPTSRTRSPSGWRRRTLQRADDYEPTLLHCARSWKPLTQRWSQGSGRASRTELVTSHEAFGYLASRYGLHQVGISGSVARSGADGRDPRRGERLRRGPRRDHDLLRDAGRRQRRADGRRRDRCRARGARPRGGHHRRLGGAGLLRSHAGQPRRAPEWAEPARDRRKRHGDTGTEAERPAGRVRRHARGPWRRPVGRRRRGRRGARRRTGRASPPWSAACSGWPRCRRARSSCSAARARGSRERHRLGYVPQRHTVAGAIPSTVARSSSSGRLSRRKLFSRWTSEDRRGRGRGPSHRRAAGPDRTPRSPRCPAASSAASSSPARWPPSPTCSSWTSRPPGSTRPASRPSRRPLAAGSREARTLLIVTHEVAPLAAVVTRAS